MDYETNIGGLINDSRIFQGEEKLELADIDISYLSTGTHTLCLRLQNNEGTWGVIRKVTFEIYEPTFIAGAEYFIDAEVLDRREQMVAREEGGTR